MTRKSRTSDEVAVNARIKDAEVLRRRIVGQSFREIAAELGISLSGCHDSYKRAMAATVAPVQEAADEMRQIMREQLDRDLAAIEDRRMQGEPEAIRTHLLILKSKRELEGLDAPTKFTSDQRVEVHITGGEGV